MAKGPAFLVVGALVASACAPRVVGPAAAPNTPTSTAPSASPFTQASEAPQVAPSTQPSPSPEARYGQLDARGGAVGAVGAVIQYEEIVWGRDASGAMVGLGLRLPEELRADPPALAEAVASDRLRLLKPGAGVARTRLGGWMPLLVHAPGHEPLPWLMRGDRSGGQDDSVEALAWLASEADWRAWWTAYHAHVFASMNPERWMPALPGGFDWAFEGMLIFRHSVPHAGQLPFLAELPASGPLVLEVVTTHHAPLPAAVGRSVVAFRLPQGRAWRSVQLRRPQGGEEPNWPIPEGGASGAWPDAQAAGEGDATGP